MAKVILMSSKFPLKMLNNLKQQLMDQGLTCEVLNTPQKALIKVKQCFGIKYKRLPQFRKTNKGPFKINPESHSITLNNSLILAQPFLPKTEIKMMYNEEYIYVIFRVEDKFVRAVNTDINSPVSKDSCVEFFFTPGKDISVGYYNLEVNCGGTPLFRFQKKRKVGEIKVSNEDIKRIKIAHSLPKVVEPEIKEPTTWLIEYGIPIKMLDKYHDITKPEKGVIWRANFYKCGDATSNPHYLTWNKIVHPVPNFHLPEFFGEIEFQ